MEHFRLMAFGMKLRIGFEVKLFQVALPSPGLKVKAPGSALSICWLRVASSFFSLSLFSECFRLSSELLVRFLALLRGEFAAVQLPSKLGQGNRHKLGLRHQICQRV